MEEIISITNYASSKAQWKNVHPHFFEYVPHVPKLGRKSQLQICWHVSYVVVSHAASRKVKGIGCGAQVQAKISLLKAYKNNCMKGKI